ncbi:EF-hand domain-containing protein [Parasphingopyxis algicola]|uniref:EF-hand domain-containing protein n=1 Tax=Parasphingopyxis algicola TaxID=2026624 RepID=UPI001C4096AA|nr:EF-hand domain-containing protein [Parasphingopyxis algicola]
MDRSITIGLVSFAVTASLLAIPAIANSHGGRDWAEPMTRAQMESRIAERFAEADTDGSGTVSREEAAAHSAERRAARQARRFDRMDADGDGEVSFAERDAAHAGFIERRGIHRGAMIAEERDMRGRLTPEELAALPEGALRTAPPAARETRRAARIERRNQAWAAADADGDGALDRDEFADLHAAREDRRAERRAGRFDRMDGDGDGVLTLAEASVRPLAMFERADTDADGVITRAERRAARQAMRAERRQRR